MPTLREISKMLCLNLAKKCVKNNKTSGMFPRNDVMLNTRQPERYFVPHAETYRLARSAIPYMAGLLNNNGS